jgi:hypothetical protein
LASFIFVNELRRNKMKGIYSFYWNYGRGGSVSSIFIATKEDVAKLIGKDVYFGEILGKHSEVYGNIKDEDIKLLTDNQEFIKQFEEILGENFSTGYNPFDYLSDDPEDDD